MEVPEQFVKCFKEGGNSKREAVTKLLDLIYDRVETVTIRAPDYDTLMVRVIFFLSSDSQIQSNAS